MTIHRQTIKLTNQERQEFRRLRPQVGEAFGFWERVALARDLDYKTIIYDDGFILHCRLGMENTGVGRSI